MLKRNLISNYLGQGWIAFLNLASIPIYIEYLGVEAYGLIGLFAVLQACLALFDLGMTPTLNRAVARFTGGSESPQKILNLLRSIEWTVLFLAIFIGFGVFFISHWISTEWLHSENLSLDTTEHAVVVMGLVISLRFFESIYRSIIIGLQKQVLFNVINGLFVTVRVAGVVAVLKWISPTINTFFIWQALSSFVMAIVLAIVAYRTLPKTSCGGNFSITALRDESRFAGGVLGITFLALLLTQIDKVLLSNLLTLSEYGYYALATVMAGALFTVAGPITQAWFPRLTELHAGDRESELNESFHEGAQMVSVLVGSVAIVMIVFSEAILELWIGDPVIASKVSFLVSLIAVGNLLNCLMWMPYQAQLSYGWTSLSVRINVISVIIIIPGLIWTTPYFGAVGAAYLWIALNIGYLFIGAQFMYRKILIKEKWKWYIQDLLSPVLASVLMALVCKAIANNIKLPIQNQLLGLAIVSMLILFAGAMGSNRFRRIIINKFN